MRTSARLTPFQLSATSVGESHLVITLEGDEAPEGVRPRLGIVPVVDRSGSMGTGQKLRIVTESLTHLSGHLCDEDQVALVAFDHEVTSVLAPTRADQAGMQQLRSELAALSPRGSTDLGGGIRDGVAAGAQMAAELGPEAIVRVIVLTDGLANVGARSPEELLALVSDLPAGVSVSFLGVGVDCDHDLLGRLAEAGGGSYGFIEAASRAAEVLGAEVGGLLHVDVADVRVEVRPREKFVAVAAPLGLRAEPLEDDGVVVGWSVRVGNVLSGQTRHVVLPVRPVLPGRAHARPVTVADVVVTGVVDDETYHEDLLPKCHFRPERGDEDPELTEAVELAVLADAQARAEEEARRGEFRAASSILGGLEVRSSNARVLRDAAVLNYADSSTYAASAIDRRSSMAMLNSTLAGSSERFDAMAARTVGSYTTSAQREVANDTMAAVAQSLSLTTPPLGGAGVGAVSSTTLAGTGVTWSGNVLRAEDGPGEGDAPVPAKRPRGGPSGPSRPARATKAAPAPTQAAEEGR